MLCGKKGHQIKNHYKGKNKDKKNKKAEKVVKEEDNLDMCLLTTKNKKETEINKVRFVANVKKPVEACLVYNQWGNIPFIEKNTLISKSVASCHIITMRQAFLTSPISMSWYKEIWAKCLL